MKLLIHSFHSNDHKQGFYPQSKTPVPLKTAEGLPAQVKNVLF